MSTEDNQALIHQYVDQFLYRGNYDAVFHHI